MRLNKFLIALVIVSASSTNTVNAANRFSSMIYSEWFFSETRAWTPVTRLQSMDLNYFNKVKDALRVAYDKADPHLRDESKDCSFIAGILDAKAIAHFRVTDLNLDGLSDVIYTGEAIC